MADVLGWLRDNWKEVLSVPGAVATILGFLWGLRRRRRKIQAIAMIKQGTSWHSPHVLMQNSIVNGSITLNVSAPQSAAETADQVPSGESPPIFGAILDVQADMARVGLLRQRRHILQAAVQSDSVCSVETRAGLRLRLSQAHNDLGEMDEADRHAAEAVRLLRRDAVGGEGTS